MNKVFNAVMVVLVLVLIISNALLMQTLALHQSEIDKLTTAFELQTEINQNNSARITNLNSEVDQHQERLDSHQDLFVGQTDILVFHEDVLERLVEEVFP